MKNYLAIFLIRLLTFLTYYNTIHKEYLKRDDFLKKYYAVKEGKKPGIYENWEDCKEQVNGYSGAIYKSFQNKEDALIFIKGEEKCEPSESYAYVDGSFLLENFEFSFGAVIFHNGEMKEFSKKFSDPELVTMRNVAGEIKGAEFVMKYCIENNIPAIDIYYDYMGIEKWCTGEWKANKPGTIDYRDFYNSIKDKIKVNFIKVKGHSGDKYNDLADKLAKKALGIE